MQKRIRTINRSAWHNIILEALHAGPMNGNDIVIALRARKSKHAEHSIKGMITDLKNWGLIECDPSKKDKRIDGRALCPIWRLKATPLSPNVHSTGKEPLVENSCPVARPAGAQRELPKLRETQQIVLDCLRQLGSGTDGDIAARLSDKGMSRSGLQTRRSELVTLGLVKASGRKQKLKSGRMSIVWEPVQLTNWQ